LPETLGDFFFKLAIKYFVDGHPPIFLKVFFAILDMGVGSTFEVRF
jgi:hypothetical protein